MLWTCATLVQWLKYFGFHFAQVPHTHSVSKPLPSHVYLSRNRHQKSQKLTITDTDSTFFCFHAVNLCQTAKLLQWLRCFGFHFTGTHTYSVSQPLPSHVYLSRNRHRKIAEIDVYGHGLDISLLLSSQLLPKSWDDSDMPESSSHRNPTHILSDNHCHPMCISQEIGSQNLATSAKVPQSQRYAGIKSTQVLHTYSVWQPLPSHVYWWRYSHPKIAQIHVYTHGLDISLLLCSQLPPKSFNHRDIPDYTPHTYFTHILSDNDHHPMCICEETGTEQSIKITFVQTVTTFHCFYALNFCQSPSIIEICRNKVHTGTAHIFCLTTTSIPCVFV
jgi:hypothetical protein